MSTALRSRKPRRQNSNINVVPYIDVMLVLLVIFMVTAPMISPATIDLPKVAAATSNPTQNNLVIEVVIAKDGKLTLNDRDPARAIETPVTLKDVGFQTLKRMRTGEQRPVVISADKGVVYDRVLEVMDTLKTAGVARVGLSVLAKS